MERINHIYVNRLNASEAVDSLDIRLLACGLGERIHSWPVNPFFSSEPFYRIYLPLEGRFRLRSPEEELELAPGALYLIPALTPLKFISVSPLHPLLVPLSLGTAPVHPRAGTDVPGAVPLPPPV